MISQEMRKFLAGINAQGAQKTASKGKMSTAEERANLDAFMAPLKIPGQIILEDFVLAGRPARKCAPPEASDYVVLFFHGGGYRVGSLNGYNSFMAHLALACGIPVYGLDYRLVPEYTYPAALDDAVSAFMELSRNIASERILLVGDSAGGGLALACMLALKERGLAVGGAAALLSPWLDGTASGESYRERRAEFQNAMKSYAGVSPWTRSACRLCLATIRAYRRCCFRLPRMNLCAMTRSSFINVRSQLGLIAVSRYSITLSMIFRFSPSFQRR